MPIFLEPSKTEKSARKDGEIDSALAAFRKAQDEFHVRSNEEKNSALYVDIEKGEFVSPAEKVTSRMLARLGKLNEKHLQLAEPKVEMLHKWASEPSAMTS